ncbi:MAG: hypothetical protein WCN88_01655 [Candidatus Falkowbacteria bacterium]
MKKILFVFAILAIAFSVSACTSKTALTGEENVAPTSVTADEDFNLADDINSSAPANTSATSDASQTIATDVPVDNITTMKSPENQEDLTKRILPSNY